MRWAKNTPRPTMRCSQCTYRIWRPSRWPTTDTSTTRDRRPTLPSERASDFFDSTTAAVYAGLAHVHLAAGDATAAWEAYEAARELTGMYSQTAPLYTWAALAPLACGDVAAARRWADDVVSVTTAWVGRPP